MEMIYSDFVGSQTDPLTWYDLLPGDPVRISGMPDNRPGGELARCAAAEPARQPP